MHQVTCPVTDAAVFLLWLQMGVKRAEVCSLSPVLGPIGPLSTPAMRTGVAPLLHSSRFWAKLRCRSHQALEELWAAMERDGAMFFFYFVPFSYYVPFLGLGSVC